MSATEAIAISWGGGKWPDAMKRTARPTLETALSYAQDGLAEYGIEYAQPKQAVIRRTGISNRAEGSALDATRFELYVDIKTLKRHKVHRQITDFAITSCHELVHCVRFEHFPDDEDDFLEAAASEGLAYATELKLVQDGLLPQEGMTHGVYIPEEDAINYGSLIERLAANNTMAAQSLSYQDRQELADHWFNSRPAPDLSPGESLGILAVWELMQRGASLPDLMSMPANEILGIE